MRRRVESALAYAIAVIVVVAIVAAIFWIHGHIPCSWFQFHKVGEIPARCLRHYN